VKVVQRLRGSGVPPRCGAAVTSKAAGPRQARRGGTPLPQGCCATFTDYLDYDYDNDNDNDNDAKCIP